MSNEGSHCSCITHYSFAAWLTKKNKNNKTISNLPASRKRPADSNLLLMLYFVSFFLSRAGDKQDHSFNRDAFFFLWKVLFAALLEISFNHSSHLWRDGECGLFSHDFEPTSPNRKHCLVEIIHSLMKGLFPLYHINVHTEHTGNTVKYIYF